MSEIIKQINVGGVDYDIVSESAEKKIAELEKNNTALASVTFGTRNDQGDPVKVKFGNLPVNFGSDTDIYIGSGALIGEDVKIGTEYPLYIGWEGNGSLTISSNGGNRGTITIGSNVHITPGSIGGGNSSNSDINLVGTGVIQLDGDNLYFGTDSSFSSVGKIGAGVQISMYGEETLSIHQNVMGFSLLISPYEIICNGTNLLEGSGSGSGNSYIESLDGTRLQLGTGNYTIATKGSQGIDLTIGTGTYIENFVNLGPKVAIGTLSNHYMSTANIQIGTDLQGENLSLSGPIYLATEHGATSLTIGTDTRGCISIDWGGDDKIVFTNLRSGKKATLTLS